MTTHKIPADWTKTLPDDWEFDRLGKFADIIVSNVDKKSYDEETPVQLCNYVDVYKNDYITTDIDFMDATASDHEISRFALNVGDVLATKDSENPMDIAVPALVKQELPGVLCGYHLAIVRADGRRLHGPFAAWLHLSRSIGRHYEMHATGITRWAVGKRDFKTCPVPLPPIVEQEHIADYLDASCSAIDQTVATKQKQLDNLDALCRTTVQKAVTQGLDPSVPMKDSGVEWLGPIPTHWSAKKLKRVFAEVDYGISESTEQEGQFAILKMGNIVDGEIEFTKIEYVNDVPESLVLQTNDLLFNRTNSLDQVAKVAVFRGTADDRVSLASYLVRLRTTHHNHPHFINYLVNSERFLGLARKMAIPSVQQANLNPTRYCRLEIPVPPFDEQEAIAKHLDAKTKRIASVAGQIREQIDTLVAYRKSLIHECVTGKRRISKEDVKRVKAHV